MTPETRNAGGRHSPTIGLDELHTILSSDRRRYTLRELKHRSPLGVNELIDGVTRREYGAEYTGAERKRVRISLHQAHLPKLIEHRSVVESREQYELGPTADSVLDVLKCSERAAGIDRTQDDSDGSQYNSVSSWLKNVGLSN